MCGAQIAQAGLGVGRQQQPYAGAAVERLRPPAPLGVGEAVGIDRADDERTGRLQQFDDVGFDHQCSMPGSPLKGPAQA